MIRPAEVVVASDVPARGSGGREVGLRRLWITPIRVPLALFIFASLGLTAGAEEQASDRPPFCGSVGKHVVINRPSLQPGALPDGKARVYMFWRGARWRWLRVQCKVALNGNWVAVLSPNTYSVIDVEPGKLRFCGASNYLAPTWRSLLFLHATAGETYYIECSPGGDDVGASEPTLSEPEGADGSKTVSGFRPVGFGPKPQR